MEAICSKSLEKFIPEKKSLVVLMINGVAIDEMLAVDTSVVPMTLVSLCMHCAYPR